MNGIGPKHLSFAEFAVEICEKCFFLVYSNSTHIYNLMLVNEILWYFSGEKRNLCNTNLILRMTNTVNFKFKKEK